jgi:hypothetical protein
MALYGKGMLMTFTETPPGVEEDFNEWYNREHIDERVWMPGFHRARRYVDADGDARIKYFATYETDKVEDLADPDYMELLKDQSDWSKKVMATFTKFDRVTARITIDLSHGFAGACAFARFFPAPPVMSGLRGHLESTLLPALVARPGMIGAVLAENDLAVVNEGRKAQGMAIPENETPQWIVLLEGQTTQATAAALREGFGAGLPDHGVAASDIDTGNHILMFGNNR